jgi:hypothetical protein
VRRRLATSERFVSRIWLARRPLARSLARSRWPRACNVSSPWRQAAWGLVWVNRRWVNRRWVKKALGEKALGEQALGEKALGEKALGEKALGEKALGVVGRGGDHG